MKDGLPPLIVVEGTNASGKSGLAVELARLFDGEIVSADSRQVFTGLDLGSGKITPGEMKGVRHHLLDVARPGDFFSMHDYQILAYRAIDDILSRGKLPFLAGGTGLYVDSVARGYIMSDKAPDLAYREALEKKTTAELGEMLRSLKGDVEIDWNNRNRVMRALEKLHDGDDFTPRCQARYACLKLGVTWPRPELRRRIDERLDRRCRAGMIDEVRGLIDAGVSPEFLKKLGLEYRYITEYLLGELPDEGEMLSLLATAIKQFAKRQMIWFRRDREIHWLDMAGDPVGEASGLISSFLKGKGGDGA